MERKILVAIDGSIYTTNTIHYLSRIFADIPEARLHLLSIVPVPNPPAGTEWLGELELMNILSPATLKKLRTTKSAMESAVRKLTNQGIAGDRITSEVKLQRQPVADEILHEARQGMYDALIIGRRGISKLEEIVVGSTSSDILDKAHDIPIWILDGKIESRRFLVPVDGSFNCLLAVDHLAHILQDSSHCRITLFHSSAMFANVYETYSHEFYQRWGQEWCETHLGRPDSLFHAPKQMLMDRGMPEDQISWLHTFKGFDPSRQILRQAIIDEYGTIVIGRRSKDTNKGLFRGVTDRLVLMSENVAIWIVG